MSEQTIYNALRAGGLSPAGACAMMGNMWAESGMKSNNVEDRSPLSDWDYTNAVNTGTISKDQFMYDPDPQTGKNQNYGYGLCQWTYPSRKAELYDCARSQNVSIGDEKMQCDFCIQELQRYYVGLYRDLCRTDDLADAAKRICAEYEQPAVNNFADRINAAQRFYNQFVNEDAGCGEDACPIEIPTEDTCVVNVRVLRKGCLGRDVFLLQAGLFDMGYDCGIPDGDFGVNTEGAVKQLQKVCGLEVNGTADWFVWQTVLNAR